MLIVFPIQPFLQCINDYTVCLFSLSISPWVCHQNIPDNYAFVIAEVPEIITGECGAQVSDDAVRQAKAVDNFIEQLSCLLRSPRD
jgi:hypothetical protein